MHRTALSLAVFSAVLSFAAPAQAQRLSVGAGVLLSDRPSEPTYNIHLDSPPLYKTRAELTLSWNDETSTPTIITEAERQPCQDWEWSLVLKASFMIWARH